MFGGFKATISITPAVWSQPLFSLPLTQAAYSTYSICHRYVTKIARYSGSSESAKGVLQGGPCNPRVELLQDMATAIYLLC
jgi:hypothetical protein